MKIYILLALTLFFCICSQAYAQTVQVRGTVVSGSDGSPMPGATVVLIHLPDSTRQGKIADGSGNFVFNEVARGRYILRITRLGNKVFTRPVEVADRSLDLGKLALVEDEVLLGEVEIVEKAPAAVQKGDTTEFNARAFKTNPDANAEDLVTKMPGVVMQDGKVQAQGEEVTQVLVDGKPFFGDDPTAALRTLPAEVIDKIQVFDKQSDKAQFTGFDDGNEAKTINIVTRPNMRNGQFGRLSGGYGYDNKYRAAGNINIMNDAQRLTILAQSNNVNEQNFAVEDILGVMGSGGRGGMRGGPPGGGRRGGRGGGRRGGRGGGDISDFLVDQSGGLITTHALGINYTDLWGERTEVTGSYFFNLSDNDAENDLTRRYILPSDSGLAYNETGTSTGRNMNHRLNFRLEHEIDSLNSFVFRPRMTIQQNDGNSMLFGTTTDEGALLTSNSRDFSSDLLGVTFSGELLYRHRFETRGRTFSIELTPEYNYNNGDSRLLSTTFVDDETRLPDSVRQSSSLLRNGWGLAADIEYTEPIGENSMVQIEYETSYNANTSDKDVFDYSERTDDYDIRNLLLSNTFTSDYVTQGVGTSYRFQDESVRMRVGVDYQWARLNSEREYPVTATVERTFTTLLPSAMLRYDFSQDKNLRVFYRARTSPPSIDQLQDVIDNSNPLQLSAGNPDLQQSYQHDVFMRYSAADPGASTSFFAMIGASFTNNYIANSVFTAGRDTTVYGVALAQGAQFTRPVNLDGRLSLRSFATYGLPFELISSNLNLTASASYTRTPGFINSIQNWSHSPSLGLGAVISSNISENIDFTVSSDAGVNFVSNSAQPENDTRYYTVNSRTRLNLIFGDGFVFGTDLLHRYSTGLAEGYNQNNVLWNASIGKKIFANRQGEIRLSVFDILGQNTNVNRTVNETYIEDVQTNILRRYAMLTFTYTLRNFGGGGGRGN